MRDEAGISVGALRRQGTNISLASYLRAWPETGTVRLIPVWGFVVSDALLEDGLAVAVIDALTSHICVVDRNGVIIAVNHAWKEFTANNADGEPRDHIGLNYLDVCRHSSGLAAEEAPAVIAGLRSVLRGEREIFQIEYPCHSSQELRWFMARISPLRHRNSTIGEGAVISHMNITDRKFAERNYARLAATDALTGIPNRRLFDDIAAIEFERTIRFGEPTSLLLIDLDHFKRINDVHGHLAGDEALRRVASIGTGVLRASDLFARLGGEEFVCLLHGTDERGAVVAAETLRAEIEQLDIVAATKKVLLTASIGIASIGGNDRSIVDTLDRADKALYLAKAHGRNCVRSWTPNERAA